MAALVALAAARAPQNSAAATQCGAVTDPDRSTSTPAAVGPSSRAAVMIESTTACTDARPAPRAYRRASGTASEHDECAEGMAIKTWVHIAATVGGTEP